jgi:hypothetical protein
MKHLYILTILLGVGLYAFLLLLARSEGDTWGYLQWGLLGVIQPFLAFATFRSWAHLSTND